MIGFRTSKVNQFCTRVFLIKSLETINPKMILMEVVQDIEERLRDSERILGEIRGRKITHGQ